MLDLINIAFAQEVTDIAAKQPSPWASMLPLVLIMVVFYFLLIRPQQKKMREHQLMIQGVSKGNEVVTNGGIFGEITKIEEDAGILHLKIADNVQIRVRREMVSEVLNTSVAKAAAKEVAKQSSKKSEPKGKAKKG
ncbi:MAG: preprotein translocase, YajC subunit [Candidatus Midichloriaceae bacterium]|jgi:preprotein translocase subunit YajC|nr:preprotein translocase, YajC subunit [Candidatus Midichloriaceae bacterium]